MKLAIMQPYFFPYIGYWQLMNAVDRYVIYDDVNYIKGGWINRNRILVNGEPKYFNIPMQGASPYKLINEVGVNNDEKLIEKNLRMIEGAYQRAPNYSAVYPLMEKSLRCGQECISDYILASFKIICDYLGIKTELIISSTLEKDCSLKAQDKVLAICELLGATDYWNAIGGQELYSFAGFKERGIKLKFLKTGNVEYVQFGGEFQRSLSIIDVMMFNSKEQVQSILLNYTLITD